MALKRQSIFDALMVAIRTINQGAGYRTNLGANAFQWRQTPLAPNETPGISIRDMKDNTIDFSQAPAHSMSEHHELFIEMDIVVNSTTDMRNAVQDIRDAIAQDETFGGLAIRTWPMSVTTVVSEDGLKVLGATFEIKVEYRTPKWGES